MSTLQRVSEVLLELSSEIEQLGAVLCEDSEICERHAALLQQIDRIAQTQRGLADIVAAPNPELAIDAVNLDRLRCAMRR